MQTLYQIVSTDGGETLTAAELAARYDVTDLESGTHLRPELRGHPRIKGLCGPMWGGWQDAAGESIFLTNDRDPESAPQSYSPSQGPVAVAVVRYETWEAYEVYSR